MYVLIEYQFILFYMLDSVRSSPFPIENEVDVLWKADVREKNEESIGKSSVLESIIGGTFFLEDLINTPRVSHACVNVGCTSYNEAASVPITHSQYCCERTSSAGI
ncbi:hypothetical protein ACET3Z_004929 [Daucus carota]